MCLVARKFLMLSATLALFAGSASAQKQYGPGVSDTEIKIGNIMPYSGPASVYSIVGKTMSAYFRMINDNGGVNGRRINLISYDDGYSPPKTVEQARRLVESDEVFLIFAPLGTATNAAIQKYMNTMRVPQLFVLSGASRWGDPEHFPWTIGLQPSYRAEARVYAAYILEHHPYARIGVLYQNDDFGRDYILGLKDVLRDGYAKVIVAIAPYETSTPTVQSQVVAIKAANPGMQRFRAFMAKYYPEADRSESGPMIAYNASNALVEVLKRCGDNLARENVMKVVA